jgi:hypothetical protein
MTLEWAGGRCKFATYKIHGLSDPTADQLASWQEYDAPLTAYSNKDADWPYPTAASPNWLGSTWNGDPLACRRRWKVRYRNVVRWFAIASEVVVAEKI